MPAVRISKGRGDPTTMPEAERLLIASEAALRDPLQQLHGLVHYYVGIDREQGFVTNVTRLGDPPRRSPDGLAGGDARAAPDPRGGRDQL